MLHFNQVKSKVFHTKVKYSWHIEREWTTIKCIGKYYAKYSVIQFQSVLSLPPYTTTCEVWNNSMVYITISILQLKSIICDIWELEEFQFHTSLSIECSSLVRAHLKYIADILRLVCTYVQMWIRCIFMTKSGQYGEDARNRNYYL